MGADEVGTLEALKAIRREIVDPALAEHKGRIVKTTGDGLLVEFASAVDAVTCAAVVQEKMARQPRQISFRIGINIGDIISDENDIFGDGVNVAARIENECAPGGVCLSGSAFEQVRGKTKLGFDDFGERSLKNIDRPVRLYSVRLGDATMATIVDDNRPLPLPDKPSIAVLPFQNMSGDPEQEYFADGIVEEIITGLSINKSLFVIARNSSFTYRGKAVDVRQVGRDLGVRYVLEGSVRKSGNRMRIAGQLIDAINGAHLWAERFDGDLEDIFDLQDQLAGRVIVGIAPLLERAEIERVKKKTDNLQAYDCYMRCLAAFNRTTTEGCREALDFARQVVAVDPDFALGHAAIARTHNKARAFGWMTNERDDCAEAERAVRQALELDRNDANVLGFCGQALIHILRRLEEGASLLDRSVTIDTNLAFAWTQRGLSRIALDQPDEAIVYLERSLRLSPLDFTKEYTLTLLARAHNLRGTPQKGLPFAAEAVRLRPHYPMIPIDAAVAHVLTGDIEAGRRLVGMYCKLRPSHILTDLDVASGWGRLWSPRIREMYVEALRAAGFPE